MCLTKNKKQGLFKELLPSVKLNKKPLLMFNWFELKQKLQLLKSNRLLSLTTPL